MIKSPSTYRIFALPLFQDNYSYVLQGFGKKSLALIDPANPDVIVPYIKKYFSSHSVSHILYTHKHWDHAGNCKELMAALDNNPAIQVFIGQNDHKQVPTANCLLKGNQTVKVGASNVNTYEVPCHTRGHIIYHFLPINSCNQNSSADSKFASEQTLHETVEGKKVRILQSQECAFTGDTIFCGGVGRFFQGNAKEMVENIQLLTQKIHDKVHIYNGHEYTYNNLKWAAATQKENPKAQEYLQQLQKRKQQCGTQGIVTLPTTFQFQKQINPFVRAVTGTYLHQYITQDKVKLMTILREMKNKGQTEFPAQLKKGSL